MTRTFFDAVLDETQFPVFNGTPEETKQWLLDNRDAWNLSVCVGKTMKMVPVAEYMQDTLAQERLRRLELMKYCPVCGKELELPPISGIQVCFPHGDVVVREDEIVFRLSRMA